MYEDIESLAAFEELDSANLASALNGLLDVLEDVEANFVLFKDPIPAINKSLSDLLSWSADSPRASTMPTEFLMPQLRP
jgi:hypothetical protein